MKPRGLLLSLLLVACTSVAPSPSSPSPAVTRSPGGASTPLPADRPLASARPTPEATPQPSFTGAEIANRLDPPAMFAHLEAFQRIAGGASGNRATGTSGFDASVRYVSRVLAASGYRVDEHRFEAAGAASVNLLVEVPGTGDGVLVLGAHLDSVPAGPGINDNGSGVAALLDLARAIRELPPPVRTVRFAFWGAEEGGPFGSAAYVADLTMAERDEIVAYLNFDMLASPNAVTFVYDEADAIDGSEAITTRFVGHLGFAGLASERIDLEGDSDHGPFVAAGIPTGGLFSGGIEPVTDRQAARHGATAGEPADACSHRACDTIDNVDLAILSRLSHVIARVLGDLALGDA
jgi:aminopeptidase S